MRELYACVLAGLQYRRWCRLALPVWRHLRHFNFPVVNLYSYGHSWSLRFFLYCHHALGCHGFLFTFCLKFFFKLIYKT